MKTIEERAKAIVTENGRFPFDEYARHRYSDLVQLATEQDRIARQEERERCIQIAQKLLCEKCLGNNECSICGDYGAPSATGWMCTKRLLIREAIEKGE